MDEISYQKLLKVMVVCITTSMGALMCQHCVV